MSGRHGRPTSTSSRPPLVAALVVAALVASIAVAWMLVGRWGRAPSGEIASIAVLPFADMSQAQGPGVLFGRALRGTARRASPRSRSCASSGERRRSSSRARTRTCASSAEKLGVDHLLEGSVRKEGNRVRITAQLIKVSDGSHLWSETYDRTVDDVFKLQDEIADATAQAMKVTLLGGPMARTEGAGEQRSAQPLPRGALLLQAPDEGRLRESDRLVQEGARGRSGLRSGMGRARLGLRPSGGPWTHSRRVWKQAGSRCGATGARARHDTRRGAHRDGVHPHGLRLGLGGCGRRSEAGARPGPWKCRRVGTAQASWRAPSVASTRRSPFTNRRWRGIRSARRSTTTWAWLSTTPADCPRPRRCCASCSSCARALPPDRLISARCSSREDSRRQRSPKSRRSPSDAWRAIGLPLAYHALGRKAESDAALR